MRSMYCVAIHASSPAVGDHSRAFDTLRVRRATGSARTRDESADLLRRGEDHVGAVSHHAGRHDRGRAFLRTVAAAVGLEAQIPFPQVARLPVRRGHLVAIPPMLDAL